jgi:NAD(P)-dependent dehydrogenase (short-subunit alcohol dehydrogenase family)
MDFSNASAIVTGGAGAFGSATVRTLAQKGAKAVIADVSDRRGEAPAKEVGADSVYVPTDCMDEDPRPSRRYRTYGEAATRRELSHGFPAVSLGLTTPSHSPGHNCADPCRATRRPWQLVADHLEV